MFQKKSGFTFVELIVATTIIAILASLGFLSYTNQLGTSRDGRRISEVTSISQKLDLVATKGRLPYPSSNIQITTTSAIQTNLTGPLLVGYQGEFGSELLKQIGLETGGVDPKDKIPYIYYITKDRRFSQLMIYLEDASNLTSSIFPQANAGLSDYSTRFTKFFGKPLGIITENSTKRSIHDIFSGSGFFNIVTTGNNYTVNFSDKEKTTGSAINLVTTIPNKNCKRLRDIGASNGDGVYKINPTGAGEIEVYCDMTSDGGGWTLVMKNDGNSDSGALLNQRNTANGYNTTQLLKNTFGLTTTSASGSATLSDTLINSIYTEQYRAETLSGDKVYATFPTGTTYDASIALTKKKGCTYKSDASYSITSLNSGISNAGFSTNYTNPGRIIIDLYAYNSTYGVYNIATLCSGTAVASGGKGKIWVR